ncbi:MAG: insulinase family protein [Sandaracinaceae bacterium]|nr:insulinase family protein [Sandaracinaceae bacterium]
MSTPLSLVARLNRGVRRGNARLEFLGTVPFGGTLRVLRFKLGNGLRIAILVDPAAPVVSYHTWFRVGSRFEEQGKTGLAHFFEHMMFNESANLPAGEFDRKMEEAGGETNAATWIDWTYYYESLPKEELRLAIELESERMHNLVVRETQVESEREVVANERRMSVDDDVYGKANELVWELAFGREHPHGWPTIGWMQDIAGYRVRDCAAFYKTWYAPNNATVAIAGDVDVEHALSLVQEHYGPLKPSKLRPLDPPPAIKQRKERRAEIAWPTPTPKEVIAWHVPPYLERDHAVAVVIDDLLTGGRSGRLRRLLVQELELVTDVSTSVAGLAHGGLFELWVSMREGIQLEKALRVVEKELLRLQKTRPSRAELDKIVNRTELQFLSHVETAAGKAYQIGFGETVAGDPAHAFHRVEQMRSVTPDDVCRVARELFRPERSTRVRVVPKEAA